MNHRADWQCAAPICQAINKMYMDGLSFRPKQLAKQFELNTQQIGRVTKILAEMGYLVKTNTGKQVRWKALRLIPPISPYKFRQMAITSVCARFGEAM